MMTMRAFALALIIALARGTAWQLNRGDAMTVWMCLIVTCCVFLAIEETI